MNGIINLKKESGMSSHTCVARVRRILNTEKVGHPGTLDPEATGVLPILVGSATKCSDFFLDIGKAYVGTATFGIKTDTQDIWGNTLETSEKRPTEDAVREALKLFVGDIMQVPPMYSALKKDGVPLYKLARKGETIAQEPRPVHVYEARLLEFTGDTAKIYIHCGRGTYIRTIINDLGEKLGCLAAMSALERVSYGPYRIENAVTLSELSERKEECITKMDMLFTDFPKLTLNEINLKRYLQGKTVSVKRDELKDEGENLCLYTEDGIFFATCSWKRNAEDNKITLIRGRFFGL